MVRIARQVAKPPSLIDLKNLVPLRLCGKNLSSSESQHLKKEKPSFSGEKRRYLQLIYNLNNYKI